MALPSFPGIFNSAVSTAELPFGKTVHAHGRGEPRMPNGLNSELIEQGAIWPEAANLGIHFFEGVGPAAEPTSPNSSQPMRFFFEKKFSYFESLFRLPQRRSQVFA
jgi:hypothetical protein